MGRRSMVGAIVGLATVASIGVSAPAQAQKVVITDRAGDSYSGADWEQPDNDDIGDITRVVLNHSRKRVSVNVTLNPRTGYPDAFVAQIDTRRGHPGPEYEVWFGYDFMSEPGRYEVTILDPKAWESKPCRGARAPRKNGSSQWVGGQQAFSVPRRCLGKPGKVRVKVWTLQEHGTDDWAGGTTKATWSRWARRG